MVGVGVLVGVNVAVLVGCGVSVGAVVAAGAQDDRRKAMNKNMLMAFITFSFLSNIPISNPCTSSGAG